MSGSSARTYRLGVAVAAVAALLTVWTTVVRDDDTGMNWFLVVMASVVGAFAAWFRAAGMARAMLGVAMMQTMLGVAIATAPSTANIPGGSLRPLLFSGAFTALWLLSAALFRVASKRERMEQGAT
jgi:hypothetical protein